MKDPRGKTLDTVCLQTNANWDTSNQSAVNQTATPKPVKQTPKTLKIRGWMPEKNLLPMQTGGQWGNLEFWKWDKVLQYHLTN